MPDIHCRIEGVDDMVRAYIRMSDTVARAVPAAVKSGVKAGAREAKQTHRFQNRTGQLEKSIDGQLTAFTLGAAEGVMLAAQPYASFVEEGTRSHFIYPKAATGTPKASLKPGQTKRKRGTGPARKALAFEMDGQLIFRAWVKHPGTKPLPFMGPAFFKCERVLLKTLEEAFDKARADFK